VLVGRRLLLALVAVTWIAASCSSGDGGEEAVEVGPTPSSTAVTTTGAALLPEPTAGPATTAALPVGSAVASVPSTTAAPSPTTTMAPPPPTTAPPPPPAGACPSVDVPGNPARGGGTDASYDGDGDGLPDELEVLDLGGRGWWVRVSWGRGGSSVMAVDALAGMGEAGPIGGYDVDGDGRDEAFLWAGDVPAGRVVMVAAGDCELFPVLDTAGSAPWAAPVGAEIGVAVDGVRCREDTVVTYRLLPQPPEEPDEPDPASTSSTSSTTSSPTTTTEPLVVYEGELVPWVLDADLVTAGFAETGGVRGDEEAAAAGDFRCGELAWPEQPPR
jgi:hypothetical protein